MFSLYHFTVAVRKSTGTRKPAKKTPNSVQKGRSRKPAAGKGKKSFSPAILFWLAFAILVLGLFLFNREAISNSIQSIQKQPGPRKEAPAEEVPLPPPPVSSGVNPAPPKTPSEIAPVTAIQAPPPAKPQAREASPTAPREDQGDSRSKTIQNPPARQSPEPVQSTGVVQSPGTVQSTQTGQSPAELRDRVLYFSQVDGDGSILRVKVNRKLPVSDSPMTDVIQALITGPDSDEKHRGLISLIPPGTSILSATVRDDTAYISFSEDFQYNSYGVEGYAGQLRQIVYTVTEFPNVKNVQILIEGRRVDYLGEGIWIGSPLTRDTL